MEKNNLQDEVEKGRLHRLKFSLLPSLSRDQRKIIYLRFWESCTIEEISKVVRLSWDEVDEIIESTLDQLKTQLLKNDESLSKPKFADDTDVLGICVEKKEKEIFQTFKGGSMENTNQNQFHYFQAFTGSLNPDGEVEKEKSVGFASIREGQVNYTLKLWTFPGERYFLIPSRDDSKKLLIMTREPVRKPDPLTNRKYNWSIVGNADIHKEKGFAMLEFDLLSKPVFMNIEPNADRPDF